MDDSDVRATLAALGRRGVDSRALARRATEEGERRRSSRVATRTLGALAAAAVLGAVEAETWASHEQAALERVLGARAEVVCLP
jgi:anti-sigma factor RsiW